MIIVGNFPTNVMATLLAKRGRMIGAPVDGTTYICPAVVGGIDRNGFLSALVVVTGALNITTRAGDFTSTITVTIEDSESTADADFDTYKAAITKSFVIDSTGVIEVCMAVPVDLAAAKRYIRVKILTTSGGNTFTTTIPHSIGACVILGGGVEKPDSNYDDSAYYDNDETDVA